MSEKLINPASSFSRTAYTNKVRSVRAVTLPRHLVIPLQLALLVMIGIAVIRGTQKIFDSFSNPLSQMEGSLPLVGIVCATGAILLVVVNVIEKRFRAPPEYARKLAHVGAGAISLVLPLLFSSHWPVLFITVAFSGVLLLSRRSDWLLCLHFDASRGKNDILFLWAVYLVFLVVDGNLLLFQIPVLVLTVGDAVAALAGQRYGRLCYKVSDNVRTLEGSLAFFGSTVVCLIFVLLSLEGMELTQSIALSAIIALTASAVEALSPKGLDNLTIPIATLFLLQAVLY